MLVWLKHQKYPFWPAVVSTSGLGDTPLKPLHFCSLAPHLCLLGPGRALYWGKPTAL